MDDLKLHSPPPCCRIVVPEAGVVPAHEDGAREVLGQQTQVLPQSRRVQHLVLRRRHERRADAAAVEIYYFARGQARGEKAEA